MRRPCFSAFHRFCLTLFSLAFLANLGRASIEFAWPTPMPVLKNGLGEADFLQATASGELESGSFGCVRSGGAKYHEGIDIKPTTRDRKGEATDDIYAAMDGVVRHVSKFAGESSYGRYIVIEHPDQSPAIYTLYAHVSKVVPGISAGTRVRRGQTIATMGRSAGGYVIPRDRAHLHFEIGLYSTRNFQFWYAGKKFGSPNQHGNWNGMNLLGIDAWDFCTQWKQGRVEAFSDYFARLPAALSFRIATHRVPDFIERYPSLRKGEVDSGLVAGWEITVSPTGLPFRWTALSPMQVAGMKPGQVLITETDDALLRKNRCRELVRTKRGQKVPGEDLDTIIELLFGLR